MLQKIVAELKKTEHGFKHIMHAGDGLLADKSSDHLAQAKDLLEDESYQGRMLGTYMLGMLASQSNAALKLLKTTAANDDNWRVQEMLAKAIDNYCKVTGYEKALPEIKKWLAAKKPNLNRAVIEGLRIWTSRPYFKEHPEVAIALISAHKANASEYVRKSVGNALRDISKKHRALVVQELQQWDLNDAAVAYTYKLADMLKGK